MITVLDNEIGSVQAVCNALTYMDIKHKLVTQLFGDEDFLIVPGTGAFDQYLMSLGDENKLAIKQHIACNRPYIGICVGMQILFEDSQEGDEPGLGIFDGRVTKIRASKAFPVPHVGWRHIDWHVAPSDTEESNYYFVHSYGAPVTDCCEASFIYNGLRYSAVTRKGNCVGIQFHPEKSGIRGLRFFKNVIEEAHV